MSAAVEYRPGAVGYQEGKCNCALCVHGRLVTSLEHSWDGIHEQSGSKEMDAAFGFNALKEIAEMGKSRAAQRAAESVRVMEHCFKYNTAEHEGDPEKPHPLLVFLARNFMESGREIGEVIEEIRSEEAAQGPVPAAEATASS